MPALALTPVALPVVALFEVLAVAHWRAPTAGFRRSRRSLSLPQLSLHCCSESAPRLLLEQTRAERSGTDFAEVTPLCVGRVALLSVLRRCSQLARQSIADTRCRDGSA